MNHEWNTFAFELRQFESSARRVAKGDLKRFGKWPDFLLKLQQKIDDHCRLIPVGPMEARE